MKKVLKLILFIWQLPQIILGLIVRLVTNAERTEITSSLFGKDIFYWKYNSGLSLSDKYIFVNSGCKVNVIKHEIGHTKQSLYLGPLYLLVIGLPSLIWCGIYNYTTWINKAKHSYYWFYTEAWADRLGGVQR